MKGAKLEKLAEKVKCGDERAFEQLYELMKKGVFSFIYSMTNNYHSSEDLMQDTFIKVKQNIRLYERKGSFSAWVLQIAKNITLNYIKRESRSCFLDEESYARVADDKSDFTTPTIDAVKQILPEDEYKIVMMFVVGEFKHKEIAELLDLPLGTVTWKYSKAIKAVKEYFKKEQSVGKEAK